MPSFGRPTASVLYFAGVWHGKVNLHVADLKGKLRQITDDPADYSLVSLLPGENQLLVKRHSSLPSDEIYTVDVKNGRVAPTHRGKQVVLRSPRVGDVKERWTKT